MRENGFTLVEILILVGVVVVLSAVVWLTTNPLREYQRVRDAKRRVDLYDVVSAVYRYEKENNDQLPSAVTGTPNDIGTGGLNLVNDLVPVYIADIPVDPLNGNSVTTGYVLFVASSGRIVASASGELMTNITVSR